MKLRSMVRDIVAAFRQELEVLVETVAAEELTPESFREFVEGLKAACGKAGLESFERTLCELDDPAAYVEYGGEKHRFKARYEKEWLTPFGLATVSRCYYQPDAGGKGVVPLDVYCGMEGRYMTPDIEELTALTAAAMVPSEVETFLGKALPRGPSATAIQRVIRDVGTFAEQHEQIVESVMRGDVPLTSDGDVLVVSVDGVTTPLREKGVKTGRPADRPGVREDNRSPTSWKESGVATVSIYAAPNDEAEGPQRLDCRYFARMPEPGMVHLHNQVESLAAHLTEHREFREVVVVCDGKRSLWNAIEGSKVFRRWTKILDFYHAVEHLSRAAEAIFGKRSDKAKRWFSKYRSEMRDQKNGTKAAIRSMSYYLKRLRKGSERYHTVRRVIRYFRRNLTKMNYASIRNRGLPIGSGPVEAACKTVVGARLKRSGMRWSREGGQRVLNLRVHVLSKRWEAFWNMYLDARTAA